jgi:hypothetical protein
MVYIAKQRVRSFISYRRSFVSAVSTVYSRSVSPYLLQRISVIVLSVNSSFQYGNVATITFAGVLEKIGVCV